MEKVKSYIIAIFRLIFLLNIGFWEGIHIILFRNVEITSIRFEADVLRCNRTKRSYVDDLNMSNLDLYSYSQNTDIEDNDEGNDGNEK
jgi:hypothetical protein